jgi:hypothetical protein
MFLSHEDILSSEVSGLRGEVHRRALLVYGHLPPVRIRLRPWFRSPRLAQLARATAPLPAGRLVTSGAPLAPVEPGLPAVPTVAGGDEGVAA